MRRRRFLQSVAVLSASPIQAQIGSDPLEHMTARATPTIVLSQVGFRPDAKKRVIVRQRAATSFTLEEVGGSGFQKTFGLHHLDNQTMAGDFSQITKPGNYQIRVADEVSPPFPVQADAWRRHLPLMLSYHKAQRCGVACHLDDARRRDDGRHVDTIGGWHDAGDLRKWMDATMMNSFGLLALARNLGDSLAGVEEELRWGNRYFLKMQDTDGQVWGDVAGGVNGDNSDNHWTDNVVGTSDDRYLNPGKGGPVQGMFAALQAMYAQHFLADAAYSRQCLEAARRCWNSNDRQGNTEQLSWWTLAAVELYRATHEQTFAAAAHQLADRLTGLLQRGGKSLSGFWPIWQGADQPYKSPVHGALPPFVLLEAARLFPKATTWKAAVKHHIEMYVEPMLAKSAYGVMPFGVFNGSPTAELYRPLDGPFTYRHFMPVRKEFWWLGLNGHLGSHALMLATAARDLGQSRWRDMAYQQLEWIFGANPFGISMASGIGTRVARSFSPFAGVIPGGIMNGICGNLEDEPVMDLGRSPTWRSNEYWSPHVGYFEWTQSVLEGVIPANGI